MTPMLVPTTTEVVRCVRETLDQVLTPALTGDMARSAAATMSHMLAFVEQRIEHEGQALLDEIGRLTALFGRAVDWLDTQSNARSLRSAIEASLAETPDPSVYPSLDLLAQRVAVRRQHVCDLLERLQIASAEDRGEAGDALHQSLRDYIAWQLAEEGKIVEPAFVGRGPRR